MNVVTKKNPKKNNDGRPSIPVVNPTFMKPQNFLNNFRATNKPTLLETTYRQQQCQPNYKYETPLISRSSLNAGSSNIPTSNQSSSRKVSFCGDINEIRGTSSSSSGFTLERSSLSANKQTTSSSRTPSSSSHDRSFSIFASTSSSSRTKESRTPRSTSSGTTATSNQSRVIVAVTEGRGNARGEVGLAAIDVRHPCLMMCQLSDTHNYRNTVAKLNVLNPSVLLFPNTIVDNQKNSKLYQTIQRKFPNATQTSLHRKFYNDEEGISMVKSLQLPECSSIELVVVRKYFTLAAAAALMKYVEYVENVTLASGSVPMEYLAVDKVMMIDFETMHNLELILSQANHTASRSLYGILNQCFTFGGKRRLRSALLQPSFVEKDLNDRLDCVTELVENTEFRQNVQHTLAKIPDIELLLKICFIPVNPKSDDTSISMMNYIILLKTILDVLPSLYEILLGAETDYFKKVAKCLTDPRLAAISDEIDNLIVKEAQRVKGYAASQFQRCYAIKQEVNGLLDVARYTYSELVNEFQAKVTELASDYVLPLKCANTSTKGFHITLNVQGQRDFQIKNLPPIFIQAQKTKNTVTMTTKDLVFQNERIKQALQEVQLMSNAILQEFLEKIRDKTGCLYNLCDSMAELDLIVALSRVSASTGYVRPIFGPKLALKSARHPILDFCNSSVPVGNDVAATDLRNFHIITGPNMGGKSIYIKQIALIQIMAQIGCYVPAQEAEVKLMDHLFTRISFEDSIECNASHFTLELREMEHILRSKTDSSLVIIDEFCRGTAGDEGTAIAWATAEIFINSTIYTFFATHFHFSTRLRDLYPQVSCWYFDANIHQPEGSSRPRLNYTHKLLPGATTIEHYGLKLAESTALPESMKEAAYEFAENLSKTKKQSLEWHMTEETKQQVAADTLCLKLVDMVDNKELTLESLAAAIAECEIADILRSEDDKNPVNENNGENTIEINTQQTHELSGNTTYNDGDKTLLLPENKDNNERNSSVGLQQYKSLDNSMDSQLDLQDTLILEPETDPDITNKMDSSGFNFVSSTPMNSTVTSWLSPHSKASIPITNQALTNRNVETTCNLTYVSPDHNKKDLGLHKLAKRSKNMSTDEKSSSPLILSLSDRIQTQFLTPGEREYLPSDASQKYSKLLQKDSDFESSKSIHQKLKSDERGQWCSTISSPVNKTPDRYEAVSPQSQKSTHSDYFTGSPNNFNSSTQKNSKSKPKRFSEFHDSSPATTVSEQVCAYSKSNLKPKLHDVSWATHCSSVSGPSPLRRRLEQLESPYTENNSTRDSLDFNGGKDNKQDKITLLAKSNALKNLQQYGSFSDSDCSWTDSQNMLTSAPEEKPEQTYVVSYDAPKSVDQNPFYDKIEYVEAVQSKSKLNPLQKDISEIFHEKGQSSPEYSSQVSNILDSYPYEDSFAKFQTTNPDISMQSRADSSFNFSDALDNVSLIMSPLDRSNYDQQFHGYSETSLSSPNKLSPRILPFPSKHQAKSKYSPQSLIASTQEDHKNQAVKPRKLSKSYTRESKYSPQTCLASIQENQKNQAVRPCRSPKSYQFPLDFPNSDNLNNHPSNIISSPDFLENADGDESRISIDSVILTQESIKLLSEGGNSDHNV